LAHTIRARIEEIKRYSVEARVNEWEGQVVVSAAILPDGRIVDIRVLESSGNRRLDEDAKTMVGHASPLALSQPIGLAKVTVKVPIIFGLRR
jgi:TonB family protein